MKQILIILSLLILPFSSGAKSLVEWDGHLGASFFYLDWQQLMVDSICPVYSEVIPLETDYRENDYKVDLLYPEWEIMTQSESKKIAQWDKRIGEDLRLLTHVGVSRGDGLLDVSFVPIVRRNGKYMKLLSAKMEIRPLRKAKKAKALHAKAITERYTRTSKLAEGKWVKISIEEDGMYRLTRSFLKSLGFSNPDKVHLYGHGGHRLSEVSVPEEEFDDLEEVPLFKADADSWLFWGNGVLYWKENERIINPYSTYAFYFLREEEVPSHIGEKDGATTTSTPITQTAAHVLYEKDAFFYAPYGHHLFDPDDYAINNRHSYTLAIPTATNGGEKLTIAFTASNKSVTEVLPKVNNVSLSSFTVPKNGENDKGMLLTQSYDVASLSKGKAWNVNITTTQGNTAHLDYLALHYNRPIHPEGSFVMFSAEKEGNATYQVSGYQVGMRVMQIGEPGEPATLINGATSGSTFTFSTEDGMRRFVCFNPAASFPEPKSWGNVAPQNLHGLDQADMVIIVPANGKLNAEAERLAEAHRAYDGMRVHVVQADQIFNEFSSGTPDATAYRRLMKMFYDRATTDDDRPRYLLLFGDCIFDNRMISTQFFNYNPNDYLLCFESENSLSETKSYVLEEYFGMLDDGEGAVLTKDKPDLGVGRFPVTNASDARVMVDKAISYISHATDNPWKNVVLMLGDDGDANSHMNYSNLIGESIMQKNPDLEVRKVMWDAYKRVLNVTTTYPEVTRLIQKAHQDGVAYVNYTGHGADYVLSHEAAWNNEHFRALSQGNMLPVWFTAACNTAPFDKGGEVLGEVAVLNPNGGALAFVGTPRTVFSNGNYQINRYFTQYLFGKDAKLRRYRLGDALRLSKCALVGQEFDASENKMQYTLLGDPALIIGEPLNKIRTTTIINSKTGEKTQQLKAGMPVTIKGEVLNSKDETMPDFNGIMSIRIYDSKDTIICRRNAGDVKEAFTYTDRSNVIYTGRDSVRNGQFSVSFIVPLDIKYSGGEGRIVLYAVDKTKRLEANGSDETFTVGGFFDNNDEVGPDIELTLNGEYGGRVNSTPYLVARLHDDSGINVSGNGIGHDLLLMVDNDPSHTYILNEYYQSDFGDFTNGSLAFTLPDLQPGNHILELRAWDVLNNSNTAQLEFTVDSNYTPNILHLEASPQIAQTNTTFILSYDLPGTECIYGVEVFDFSGRRLWMHEAKGNSSTGQYRIPWNLVVGSGSGKIGSGIYLYRAFLQTPTSKLVTKSNKLIVR
ncbi:MAG: type IX secretion system sortase PorU [Bacteroidales bacterium]|nr:type IX secretion system sortase PorU [Candidatus Physcousia equi]